MIGAVCLVVLLAGLLPCLVGVCRGDPVDRLAALQAASAVATALLVLLAGAFGRPAYVDTALLLGVLTFGGTLVFARFFGRSL